MKATLSTANVSSLIPIISRFDVSKPLYSTSLRRLQKNLSNHDSITEYFSGIDSPFVKSKDDDNEPNNSGKKDTAAKQEFKPYVKNSFKQFPTYNQSSTTRSSGGMSYNTSEENSIIQQLSPEHLILIRTILILKYFCAKTKFKLAFKPYDFKDVIEQYTQGNMDILLKMKDLQRKIDQVSVQPAYGRHSTSYSDGGSPYNVPDMSMMDNQYTLTPSQKFNFTTINVKPSRRGKNNHELSPPPRLVSSMSLSERTGGTDAALVDRIGRVEASIEGLAKKLDTLISLTINSKDMIFIDE